MASQSNVIDEFEQVDDPRQQQALDDNYRSQLGIVGMQKIIDENMATSRTERSGGARSGYAFDDFPSIIAEQKDKLDSIDANIEEIDLSDDTMTSLVDRIRAHIYEVKISDALHSIVLPLAERMETLHLEDRLEALNNHRELTLYFQEIVDAINGLGDKIEDNFVRKLILEYRQFMRNPVWNSIAALNKMVISPIMGLAKTLAFGRKKRESDTDRIVRSVNELTEYLRTGRIDREKGFFKQLIEGGLVGAPVKALTRGVVSATTGISKKAAQSREDNISSGKESAGFFKNPKGFLSNLIYGDEIVRRGHIGGVAGNPIDDVNKPDTNEVDADFAETKAVKSDEFLLYDVSVETNDKLEEIHQVLEKSAQYQFMSGGLLEQITGTLKDIEKVGIEQQRQQEETFQQEIQKEVNDKRQQFVEGSRYASVIELMKADNEYQHQIENLSDKSVDIQKDQLDEAEKTNRRLFLQTIMKGLGIVTSGITSVVTSIGAVVGSLLGLKSLAKFVGNRGNVARNAVPPKGSTPKSAKPVKGGFLKRAGRRVPFLGSAIAALSMGSVAMQDNLTPEEKAGEMSVLGGGFAGAAGGAAAGGAAGAALGSVVPVVGTAVGGVIGSVLGGAAGMFLGEEAIKPFKDEIGSFMIDVGDSIGVVWDNSKDFVSDKWDSVSDWFSENIPKFGDVLAGIPDKLSDSFNSAKSWVADSFSSLGRRMMEGVDSAKASVSSVFDTMTFGLLEESTREKISNGVKSAWEWVSSIFGSLGEKLSNTFNNMKESAGDIFNTMTFGIFGEDEATATQTPEKGDAESWYAKSWDSVTGMFSDSTPDKPVSHPVSSDIVGTTGREAYARRQLMGDEVPEGNYASENSFADTKDDKPWYEKTVASVSGFFSNEEPKQLSPEDKSFVKTNKTSNISEDVSNVSVIDSSNIREQNSSSKNDAIMSKLVRLKAEQYNNIRDKSLQEKFNKEFEASGLPRESLKEIMSKATQVYKKMRSGVSIDDAVISSTSDESATYSMRASNSLNSDEKISSSADEENNTSESWYKTASDKVSSIFSNDTDDVSNRSANDVSNRSVDDVSNRFVNDVSNRSANDVSNRSANDVSNRSRIEAKIAKRREELYANDVSNRFVNDVSNRSVDDVSNRSANDVSNRSANDVSNRSVNDVSNRSVNDVSNRSRIEAKIAKRREELYANREKYGYTLNGKYIPPEEITARDMENASTSTNSVVTSSVQPDMKKPTTAVGDEGNKKPWYSSLSSIFVDENVRREGHSNKEVVSSVEKSEESSSKTEVKSARDRIQERIAKMYGDDSDNVSVPVNSTSKEVESISNISSKQVSRSAAMRTADNSETRNRQIETQTTAMPDDEDRSAYGAMKAAVDAFKSASAEDKKISMEELNILQEMLGQISEMNKFNRQNAKKKEEKPKSSGAFRVGAEKSTLTSVTSGE